MDKKKKITTHIRAESSLSVQVCSSWYKFIACKEQDLQGYTEEEANEALHELFDDVNAEVDRQVQEVVEINRDNA